MKPQLIVTLLNVVGEALDRLLTPGYRTWKGTLIPARFTIDVAPHNPCPEGRS